MLGVEILCFPVLFDTFLQCPCLQMYLRSASSDGVPMRAVPAEVRPTWRPRKQAEIDTGQVCHESIRRYEYHERRAEPGIAYRE